MTSRSSRGATSEGWFGNAYLLLSLTTTFWAGNAIVGKLASGVVTPIELTFWRWVLAVALIYVVARPHLAADWPRLARSWLRVLLLGSVGFSAFNLCLYAALNYTTALNATIEQSGMPVLIMLINFLLFGQRIAALAAVGVALTIAGVLVTATRGDPGVLLTSGLNRGDAIMLLGCVLYAAYTVALRFKPAVHWMSLLFGMAVAALAFTTPFMIVEVYYLGVRLPSTEGWLLIGYAAVFPSLFSQLFFIRGIDLIGPNRAGLFINLVPIFAAFMAVLILGERLRSYHLIGLGLVFGGIFLAERFAKADGRA